MLDFNLSIGLAGWALVIIASLAVGVVIQLIGDVQFGYEWVATAIAFGLGAVVASEFFVSLRGFEPVWDNLAIVPAAAGGLIGAGVVGLLMRYSTGGSFLHRPVSA